jgi:cytochrome c553
MRKLLRWVAYGLGALAVLILLAAGAVWLVSSQKLNAEVAPRPDHLARPTPAQLADAERQGRVFGCFSCHGNGLRGNKMFDEPNVGTIWAPNLTNIAASASDEQLARAIRQGVGADGRSLFIMQSEVFQHLTDQEVAALIAMVRAQPRGGTDTPRNVYGPLGRLGIVLGKFKSAPDMVTEYSMLEPIRVGGQYDAGHRLAVLNCSGCHNADLSGKEAKPGEMSPDLAIVGAYDLPQFKILLRTGRPAGGQKLNLMASIARTDLSHMTDAEIEQLYAYLTARAQRLSK